MAYTHGMPAQEIQQLELLSGYRHLFPPPSAKAALNPVVYSHLELILAGRRCHVLSRIGDAGLDYTQRTNKLAHHVVLDPVEIPPAGPAWLLAQPALMQANWTGEPRILPAGPRVPAGDSPPRVCRAWQQLTGDAGWGGVLAETASGPTIRQAVLVYPPGTDLLPLLAESLALLPAKRRWQVAFSTYFTKLPAGIECHWRCVVAGTPEALAAQRSRHNALVIDLGGPLGRATGGAYVEAARTGRPPAAAVHAEHLADADLEYALQETGPSTPPGARNLPGGGTRPPVASYHPQNPQRQLLNPKRKPPPRWPWVLATLALVFTLAGVAVLLWTLQFGAKKDDAPAKREAGVAVAAGQTAEHPTGAKNAKDGKPDEDQAKAEALRKRLAEKARVRDMASKFAETAKQAAQAAESAVAEAEKAVEEARSAAQQATGVRAGSAASQADQAVTDAMDVIAKARTAANSANQAAEKVATVVKADNSAVETVLDAAGAADQAAAEVNKQTDAVEDAIKTVREATGIAKDAVNKIRAIEVPFELPSPAFPQSSLVGDSSFVPIPQLQGIPATSISTLGLDEVFPEDLKVSEVRQGQVLDYYASRGNLARQRIAHITTTPNEPPRFQWDDQARHIPAEADLLRNCLLQINVPGYDDPAIVRLRRASEGKPLRVTNILRRGKSPDPESVFLGSLLPGKKIALRLEGIPEGWKIAPADSSGRSYDITVEGDVRLHFHCAVEERKDKSRKSERPVGPHDTVLQVVFTYRGAGDSSEAIYPEDRETKCRELQAELDALRAELKIPQKEAQQGKTPQHSDTKEDTDPLAKLKKEYRQFQEDLKKAKLPDKEPGQLEKRARVLQTKIDLLERTMKALEEFQARAPEQLHYSLSITVANHEIELLNTQQPPQGARENTPESK